MPGRAHCLVAERFTIEEACELQGLPRDFMAQTLFTKEGQYRAIGNGVPMAMGRALAKAVKEATEALDTPNRMS